MVCVHRCVDETLQEGIYNTGVELLVTSYVTGPRVKLYVRGSLSKPSHFGAAPSYFWS